MELRPYQQATDGLLRNTLPELTAAANAVYEKSGEKKKNGKVS